MKLREIYLKNLDLFRLNNIDFSENEVRFLLCELLGFSSAEFYIRYDDVIDDAKIREIESAVSRRLKGEPLQYIIGSWDFMGRTFKVGKGVLIPRPETELLCIKISEVLKGKKNAVVYDLCSGSGCIGITLKCEHPDIELYMIEKSDDALVYLQSNVATLCESEKCNVIKGDILKVDNFTHLPKADIIVSNPPYIRSDEVSSLQKEVTFEPEMALDGGEDGLIFYRYIAENWSSLLKNDGEFFFEIGEDQGEDVSAILSGVGFDSKVIKDYNNHDRIVNGRKVEAKNDI